VGTGFITVYQIDKKGINYTRKKGILLRFFFSGDEFFLPTLLEFPISPTYMSDEYYCSRQKE
jgi:hypothetical protein